MDTPQNLKKELTSSVGSSQSIRMAQSILLRQLWLWPIVAAILLGCVAWLVHRSVENAMRQELQGGLTAILNADVEALLLWTKDQKAIARGLANIPELRSLARELITLADNPNTPPGTLPQSSQLAKIRALLAPSLENFGYIDFFIVSSSGQIVAARDDTVLKMMVDGYRKEFFLKVLQGEPSVSKPYRSPMMLPDTDGQLKAGLPSMFTASPILNEQGKPIGVLGLRISPEAEFTKILQTARFSESGETYVFSESGLLLSQSRFDADLKHVGLLADLADAKSILTVEVRDPQANLMTGARASLPRAEQPLTKLASLAINEGGGVLMEPYGDYRGVPSVGACKWLPEYGYGIATEVDVADAFRPLYVLRLAIWGLFGLLLLSACGIFASMIVVSRQQRRMAKAEKTIKQLGQYTLENKIGSGAMGSVYRARHAFLRRPTAVKMLNTDNVSEDSLARFEREVQLTAQLYHPNTIAVYDYGRTADGVFYYAMELLEGIDLDEFVEKFGVMPEGRVISILKQVCGSLAEAHEVGLIHRDIKPANIYLTSRAGISDFVKVLDFGLAKAVNSEAAKLTQANVTMGTPYYMSPEAIERPGAVTAKSDIYAIGAVGYFLLTGTPVFTGKTIMEVCLKHTKAKVDLPSARLGRPVSEGLEQWLLRCLAKEPKDRPASTREMIEELDRIEPIGPWTKANANAWWASFKKPGQNNEAAATSISVGTEVSSSIPAGG